MDANRTLITEIAVGKPFQPTPALWCISVQLASISGFYGDRQGDSRNALARWVVVQFQLPPGKNR